MGHYQLCKERDPSMRSCLIILFLCLLPVASAGSDSIDLNPIHAGSEMIADGADRWMTRTADNIMSGCHAQPNATIPYDGEGETTYTYTNSSITNMIIGFASWSVTPFEYSSILKMMGVSLCFGIGFLIMYIFLGATYVNLSKMQPNKYKSFAHIIGAGRKYNELEDYAQNVLIGCISMAFIVIFIFVTLLFSDLLKEMVMVSIADMISPSMNVPILYLFMAIQWLVLALFFGISNVVICITAGASFILGALYTSDRTRHITERWLDYFGGMVLMQVLVVGITCLVVGVVMDIKTNHPWVLLTSPLIEVGIYMGMMVLLLLMCGGFVIGYFRIIKTAKTVVKMVA